MFCFAHKEWKTDSSQLRSWEGTVRLERGFPGKQEERKSRAVGTEAALHWPGSCCLPSCGFFLLSCLPLPSVSLAHPFSFPAFCLFSCALSPLSWRLAGSLHICLRFSLGQLPGPSLSDMDVHEGPIMAAWAFTHRSLVVQDSCFSTSCTASSVSLMGVLLIFWSEVEQGAGSLSAWPG